MTNKEKLLKEAREKFPPGTIVNCVLGNKKKYKVVDNYYYMSDIHGKPAIWNGRNTWLIAPAKSRGPIAYAEIVPPVVQEGLYEIY